MSTFKKRRGISLIPLPMKRLSVVQIIERIIALVAALEALVVTILLVIAAIRKRHVHEDGFPHIDLEEARVEENTLQVYCYGHDLYEAMQEAIAGARKSIYMESYIWKDDAAGQKFKELLAQKAAEGVAVYVIYDVFGNLVVPREFYNSFSRDIHLLGYQFIQRPWQALDPPMKLNGAIHTCAFVVQPRLTWPIPLSTSGIVTAHLAKSLSIAFRASLILTLRCTAMMLCT